jgi:predicted N-acetyltransferase YhbS
MRPTVLASWNLSGPRYAPQGLGSAASRACLHALRDTGATRAVVYPRGDSAYPVARQLYFGLGFQPVARTVTYSR